MKIAITGGTGLVGKALANEWIKHGAEVYILTRNSARNTNTSQLKYVQWQNDGDQPELSLEGVDMIVNLAGESINAGRWTEAQKKRILESRIHSTEAVVDIISKLTVKPKVLVNASAVGYYGTSTTQTFTEDDSKAGTDFLAHTVQEWEKTAMKAVELGVRTVCCRFGIVLAEKEGALPRIALPYQLFAGGTVGSGEQWVSWIHLNDAVRALMFVAENKQISGPVNITAPQPVKMKAFGKILGKVLHRPHWIPAPSFALKLLLGEMSMLVLEGQKVLPKKLEQYGYTFLYPDLQGALQQIYQNDGL